MFFGIIYAFTWIGCVPLSARVSPAIASLFHTPSHGHMRAWLTEVDWGYGMQVGQPTLSDPLGLLVESLKICLFLVLEFDIQEGLGPLNVICCIVGHSMDCRRWSFLTYRCQRPLSLLFPYLMRLPFHNLKQGRGLRRPESTTMAWTTNLGLLNTFEREWMSRKMGWSGMSNTESGFVESIQQLKCQ